MLPMMPSRKYPFQRLKMNLNFPGTWSLNKNLLQKWHKTFGSGIQDDILKIEGSYLPSFCRLSTPLWALRLDSFPPQSIILPAAFCMFNAFVLPILQVKTMENSQWCNW